MMALLDPLVAGSGEILAFLEDQATADIAREAALLAGWDDGGVRLGGLRAAHEQLLRGAAPEVLLVDVGTTPDVVSAMDRLAHACEPQTRVIALGSVNDIELYRKLLDMGLTEYVVKPCSASGLAQALRRAKASEPLLLQHPVKSSKKVALIGSRGGTGVSSLAISLGWALANRHDLATVLLDLDLRFGALPMSLDLEPSRGLKELLAAPKRIDAMLVGSVATEAQGKLRVIGAEEDLDAPLKVEAEGVEALLKALSQEAHAVVMDVPRHLDSGGSAALQAADTICVVTDLSLVGMRDTKRLMKFLPSLNANAELLLVGNRIGGIAGEVPRDEFERATEAKLHFVLPHDQKAAAAAADQGKPMLSVAPPGPFASELVRLAAKLAGEETEAPAPVPGASLLKRLLRA